MFNEEKFEAECRLNSEYNSGYDAGIRHERNRIRNCLSETVTTDVINVHELLKIIDQKG